MNHSDPSARYGFTMIELMVVICLIVILSSILIPGISLIRKQARDAECRNNLQQIGIGISQFQAQNNNSFPGLLNSLFAAKGPLEGESQKILFCPHDQKKGTDSRMNRPATANWGNIDELFLPGCSYTFEAANVGLGPDAIDWYRTSTPTEDWWGSAKNPNLTWQGAKIYQFKHGKSDGTSFSLPYAASEFPILRCFYHKTWGANPAQEKDAKVLNLAWDMSIFWSKPKWED